MKLADWLEKYFRFKPTIKPAQLPEPKVYPIEDLEEDYCENEMAFVVGLGDNDGKG
jgi:hypothetical protein